MNNYSTWGYTYSKSQRCYETLVPESHKDEPKKFFQKTNQSVIETSRTERGLSDMSLYEVVRRKV